MSSTSSIRTFSSHIGEVTSVASQDMEFISASKDNSHRLWDLRHSRSVKRYTGHQNTSKNFIRADFGSNKKFIVSGSENGHVYVWDKLSGEIVQKLEGHSSIVYNATWNERQSLLTSCSQDKSVMIWHFQDQQQQQLSESFKHKET